MKICPRCSNVYNAVDWSCPSCRFTPIEVEGFPTLAPELSRAGGGFNPAAYAELAALEDGNFWFRARNQLILLALRRQFSMVDRFLEIGCGTGYVLAAVAETYPHAAISGSEIYSIGLPFAASRVKRADLIQMDARGLPYMEEFDVIGAFDVLEHIDEDEKVLTEIFRSLRSDGGLVLTVPQHPSLWSRQDEYACHVRRYHVGELRGKVESAGFKVVFETSFVSLLLPIMAISRWVQRHSERENNPMGELHLPAILNRVFEGIMDLERLLIRIWFRFPIGGSSLLVAKKRENF